jgi:hypothetical protein
VVIPLLLQEQKVALIQFKVMMVVMEEQPVMVEHLEAVEVQVMMAKMDKAILHKLEEMEEKVLLLQSLDLLLCMLVVVEEE